ncbi:1411_t:CDS:2, partial [Ambispora leptoticha]
TLAMSKKSVHNQKKKATPRTVRNVQREPFFFQRLIMKTPCFSEEELLGNHLSYREKFKSLFPNQFESEISRLSNTAISQELRTSNAYREIINNILNQLNNKKLHELILHQLISLERKTPSIDPHHVLTLDKDQYKTYDILCNSWGPETAGKYPYFFLTGSAGTGKSYLLHMIVNFLKSKRINYLVIAPTGVAAQNVGGNTIHSALKIRQTNSYYETLSIHNQNTKDSLRKIEAIIIEEISMVSSNLFSFMSNMFGSLHSNSKIFGGIPVLLIGDLFQLPPINTHHAFYSPV